MSQEWLSTLDPEAQARAREMVALLQRLGVPHPEKVARAELRDNHPHLARFLLLRHFWTETIDPWRDDLDWVANLAQESERSPTGQFADAGRALRRLLDAGADPDDVGLLARFVAYEAVFSVVHTLDEGYDPEREDDLPGWALRERDTLGHLTGRQLGGLHENLLEHDPSGRSGRPG